MAQHFFDLSIGKDANWPYLLKGESAEYNESVSIGNFVKDGFQISSISNYHCSILAGIGEVADVDVIQRVSYSTRVPTSTYNNTGMAVVVARASGVGVTGRPSNCYYAALNANTSATLNGKDLIIYKIVDGVQTSLTSSGSVITSLPSLIEAKQTDVYIRLNCSGSTIRAKAWKVTDPEPASWQCVVTDTSLAGGDVGVIYSGYGLEMVSKWLSVGTGTDSAPLSYPGGNRIIAGTLLKPNGSPADGYLVRCYHRATGVLLGEMLSNTLGAYSFSLPISTDEKVYCLGIDQLGNTWQAPIKDLISPVLP